MFLLLSSAFRGMLSRMERGIKGLGLWGILGMLGCNSGALVPAGESGDEEETVKAQSYGEFSNSCTEAPVVVSGYWQGNFSEIAYQEHSFCGVRGPAMFVRIEVPRRSDLIVEVQGAKSWPSLAILPEGCEEGQELACTSMLPLAMEEIAAGTQLVLAVLLSEEDPLFEQEITPDPQVEREAMGIGLKIQLRAVLAEGDLCHPVSLGRCERGSACSPAAEGGAAQEPTYRCRQLAGDTCTAPYSLQLGEELMEEGVTISLRSEEEHSNAYVHQCTGHRQAEAVYQLELSQDLLPLLSPSSRLQISSQSKNVGIAVRGSDCLEEQELGCEPGQESGTVLDIAGLATMVENGEQPFVFVEIPSEFSTGEGNQEAIELRLKVVDE